MVRRVIFEWTKSSAGMAVAAIRVLRQVLRMCACCHGIGRMTASAGRCPAPGRRRRCIYRSGYAAGRALARAMAIEVVALLSIRSIGLIVGPLGCWDCLPGCRRIISSTRSQAGEGDSNLAVNRRGHIVSVVTHITGIRFRVYMGHMLAERQG